MNTGLYNFISLDLPALLALTLAAISCGLIGNFLVLRRLSLMGDAIAHAVLPGLVLAFLVTAAMGRPEQARDPFIMMLGAATSGVVTVMLIETIRRLGRVETGAAMGVAFSIMFALGVVLIEQAAARRVDLDADCVLYGQIETIFWLTPETLSGMLTFGALAQAPRQVGTLAIVAVLVVLLVILFYKELRISSFDPALSTALGFSSRLIHYAQMTVVAIAAVAAFEAVGSILVIALLICPAACARLLTDRLGPQLWISVAVAIAASIAGYTGGALAPLWVGFDHSLNAAGSVAVALGAALTLTIFLAPVHGILARRVRNARLAARIAREDLLALLHRASEEGVGTLDAAVIAATLESPRIARRAIRDAARKHEITADAVAVRLTDIGRDAGRSIVRSHRLWENYLVRTVGLRPDHVHDPAERLEHARRSPGSPISPDLMDSLDPHGRPIPPAPAGEDKRT